MDYYKKRKTTVQKLTNERSLERSTLKRDSVSAHVEERTRRIISYGPPAFQIDDMVKILKWISKSREQSVCLHTIIHNMWKQMYVEYRYDMKL